MNVLSLFDGMACGMLAMQGAGLDVAEYYAYEIDKYAIQTATHNFPQIQELGDVFNADFTKYSNIDYLIGGSPCTFWSIAQSPDKRETTASGLGWDLFSQYVRALREAKPKYFIYENNKSMSKAIRESITQTFGFEPICINSALLSAQNRQRLYWVGTRNDNGTYSKVDIEQPKDRGILLRDVLDNIGYDLTSNDKAYTLTASYNGACAWNTIERSQRNMVIEPVNTTDGGKSQTLKAQYSNTDINNICRYTSTYGASGVTEPVGTTKDGKAYCLSAGYSNGSGEKIGNYAAHTLQKGCKSMVAEPVISSVQVGALPRPNGELSQSQAFRIYDTNAKSVTLKATGGGAGGKTGLYAIPVEEWKELSENEMDYMVRGYADRRWNYCQRPAQDDKAKCLVANISKGVPYNICASPVEFENGIPTKAISCSDGKTYATHEVKDGQITIKGKTYPIKLTDGYYIIRKLTVSECKRLQTVPEWYEFPVSDTQAYKMLGNGWTVDVIAHLIKSTIKKEDDNERDNF